jgi:cysteine desulfurase
MDFEATTLPVDQNGSVALHDFEQACRSDTVLASLMYANNEVGTIAPIADLAAVAHQRGILFHTDAVQAGGQLLLDVRTLGVDLLSLSAHKFYGPKGVGLLYVRDGVKLTTSQSGGSHEDGRRAGTLNTPAIVGMAKALELAYNEWNRHVEHYRMMRDRLIDAVLASVNGAYLTGHPHHRLPSHASFIIDGVESNMLLVHLDMKGVAASSASACKTGNPEPSGVLMAMGYTPEQAMSSLRLTVGRQTTAEDVDYAVCVLSEAVEKLQRIGVA